jgi:8-oxo-dGTP pyrophosphatase MutT (NUDIX family)
MITELAGYLKEQLKGDLPGERAHVEMAPINRPMPDEARSWKDTKLSGVLILLYPHKDKIHTALMMRPDYNGVHAKQVSFPGGKKENTDSDIRQTALREANEEMGILSEHVDIIGDLSELYIPPSKSLVTPVLGYSQSRPEFQRDEKEVEEIIEADLFELLNDDSYSEIEIAMPDYVLKEVPAFLYNGFTIWGATAMMLNEFKWLLKEFNSGQAI